MSFTNLLERQILNHLFSHGNFLLVWEPPDLFVGLWIGSPGELGTGGEEVSGNGYARVEYTVWSIATDTPTVVYNLEEIVFPVATGNWGEIDYFVLCDSLTGEGVLAYDMLTNARDIVTGCIPRFGASTLKVYLD